MSKPQYHLSGESIAKVFEEWKRQWDEDPDAFQSDEDFKNDPPKSYGEGAARTFVRLVKEVLTADVPGDEPEPEISH